MPLLCSMNVKQTIGWNLRRLRVAKGFSQERLALETGIDRSYVGRVERGSENVTVATLEAVSTALDIHVSELFTKVEDNAGPTTGLKAGRKRKDAT
jgi:transcriptional regulator with XRE-family HTH domain